jgi:hypothetical protein
MSPMTPEPSTPEHSQKIGKLCVGGDWACAHGDFSGLRHVAEQLAACAPEPLHCALVELAAACNADPVRAAAIWDRLKTEVYREAHV